MKNVQSARKDFLAIILIGAGSSYARGPDKADVIKRVGRGLVEDWGSIFDVGGKQAQVNVYEVPPGIESVYWDHRGVFGEGDVPIERLELVEIELPKRRR